MGSGNTFTHNLSIATQEANNSQIANVEYVKSKMSSGGGFVKIRYNGTPINLNNTDRFNDLSIFDF